MTVQLVGADGSVVLRQLLPLLRSTVEIRTEGIAAGAWLLRVHSADGRELLNATVVKSERG